MFASKCAKCGKHRVRWVVAIPQKSECPNCGSKLAIHDEIVELDLNQHGLLQRRDIYHAECQDSFENTFELQNKSLPSSTSVN
jgi:DNA-directed RNA polymerase subunit RPC12/RpoP